MFKRITDTSYYGCTNQANECAGCSAWRATSDRRNIHFKQSKLQIETTLCCPPYDIQSELPAQWGGDVFSVPRSKKKKVCIE